MSLNINDLDHKSALSTVLIGYSICFYGGKKVFIKHLDQDIELEANAYYKQAYDHLILGGVKTKDEMLRLAIENGRWKDINEIKISDAQTKIKNLKNRKSKCLLPSDSDRIQEEIDALYNKLYVALQKRSNVLSPNAEDMALEKKNDFIVYSSFFKDKRLSDPLIEESFDDLDLDTLAELKNIYSREVISKLSTKIENIALCYDMQSMLRMCNESYFILGKPIREYTFYQRDLIELSILFKKIIENGKHDPPEDSKTDPNKLMTWWDGICKGERAFKDNKAQGKVNLNGSKAVIGASKSDLEKMFGQDNVIDTNKEMSKLADDKGSIPMSKMIQMLSS